MDRVRIKQILLPFIVKLTLIGLIVISLIFILLEMFQLVTTLTNETTLMSADNAHLYQLDSDQVLFYIKNFLFLALFGSLQTLGFYSVVVENRSVLVVYISSLMVAFIFALIDYRLAGDNALAVFYMFVQCLLTLAHIHVIHSRRSWSYASATNCNIHYIPMPKHHSLSNVAIIH